MSFFSPLGNKINKIGVEPHFNTEKIDPLRVAELLFSGNQYREYNSQLIKLVLMERIYYRY